MQFRRALFEPSIVLSNVSIPFNIEYSNIIGHSLSFDRIKIGAHISIMQVHDTSRMHQSSAKADNPDQVWGDPPADCERFPTDASRNLDEESTMHGETSWFSRRPRSDEPSLSKTGQEAIDQAENKYCEAMSLYGRNSAEVLVARRHWKHLIAQRRANGAATAQPEQEDTQH